MKNKTKKVSGERIFNLKISYGFLVLALILGFSVNYLTSYLYDLHKTLGTNRTHAIISFMLLAGGLYMMHRAIKQLDK